MKYKEMQFLKDKTGIYEIKIGNESYIGSSTNLYNRIKYHIRSLRGGSHINPKLLNSYNIHKDMQYNVLEYCEIYELQMKEQYYVDKLNPILNRRACIARSTKEYQYLKPAGSQIQNLF